MTNSNKSRQDAFIYTLDSKKVQSRIREAQMPKQPVEPKEKGSK